MKLSHDACVAFERDISLFVDHELPPAGNPRLIDHLQACPPCRDYVNDLREMAALHQTVDSEADAALADMIDRHALFASITKTLLRDKRDELARLFYELGKAYVVAGNEALSGRDHRSVMLVRRPVDIRTTTDRARRLAREGEALSIATPEPAADARETGSLFRRSRQVFSSSARAGAGALANGHRLLREALALRPDFDEARLYLGFHHMLTGRHDRARIEFRRVYRDGRDPVHRMMALQFLGNLHSTLGDYGRAIECYEEVVASGLVESEPRFYTSLVNLAVSCAKAGLASRCVQHFSELVARFPSQVDQTRALLSRAESFAAVLRRQADLHDTLRRRVPALFAA